MANTRAKNIFLTILRIIFSLVVAYSIVVVVQTIVSFASLSTGFESAIELVILLILGLLPVAIANAIIFVVSLIFFIRDIKKYKNQEIKLYTFIWDTILMALSFAVVIFGGVISKIL